MGETSDTESTLVDKVAKAVGVTAEDHFLPGLFYGMGELAISTALAEQDDQGSTKQYLDAAAAVLGNDNRTRRLLREALRGRIIYPGTKLPSEVAAEVERQCFRCYYPQVERHADGSRTFVIPPWFRAGGLSRSVRITLDRGGQCTEVSAAPLQRFVPLWPDARDKENHTYRKRSRHQRWATRMRVQLESVLGTRASAASDWLDSFEQMDAVALSVWDEMIESISMPPPLRAWSPRVGDLDLCATPERRYFASHWPWAAMALSRGDGHVRRACLRKLDRNVANSIRIANKMLCCQSLEECEKSMGVAQQMPCIPLATQQIALGRPRADTYRALLFEAGDSGHPLHAVLRQCEPSLIKDQIDYAKSVAFSLYVGGSARFALGGLLAWMLVGSDIQPKDSGVEPAALARVFLRASAECLAVFATESEHRPAEEDELGAGVVALANYFRQQRLGFQQLLRWSAAVAPPDDVLFEGDHASVFEGDRTSVWSPPPGWESHMGRDGSVTPLLSIAEIVHEGVAMDNCLAGGFYHERAAAGDIHILRLRSPDKATLALREHRAVSNTVVTRYSVVELKGMGNRVPSAETARRSETLVATLNSRAPIAIAADEFERRRKITRSFNTDEYIAARVWHQLFAPALPKRLRGSSPRQIAGTSEHVHASARSSGWYL